MCVVLFGSYMPKSFFRDMDGSQQRKGFPLPFIGRDRQVLFFSQMTGTRITNTLYMTILPMIQVDGQAIGLTTQVLTLTPDLNFATRFFPDEVDNYALMFTHRTRYLTGGHVKEYVLSKVRQTDGRIIVQVDQHVE